MKTLTLDQGIPAGNMPVRMNDAAIAGGMAFLTSELEKLDPKLREPLTSITYARDMPINSGGGWIEASTVMNVNYGVAGGQKDGVGGVQNGVRIVQANLTKDKYVVLPYEIAMQVKFLDVQRGTITGRSLEQIYDKGIRLDHDKFLDLNVYQGFSAYGTTGLVNDSNVSAGAVAAGASGHTQWMYTGAHKTPDEILADVNSLIVAAWAASQYDQTAIPNHVLIPNVQYAYIASTKVSNYADKTILEFLLSNNIAKQKGVNLFIGDCRWCAGAGANGADRMVAYVNNDRFINMDLPVPLSRAMTAPNVTNASYDSLYVANVGQVKKLYLQPIRYADGI